MSSDEVRDKLASVAGWKYCDGAIEKTFVFADFVAAFGWMSAVALVSERMNHHPEWTNAYNKVKVRLLTHDSQGVTDHDFSLAATMDRLASAEA